MPKFNAAAISGVALIAALIFSSCSATTPTAPPPTDPPPTRASIDQPPAATATRRPAAAAPTQAPTAQDTGTATPTPPQPSGPAPELASAAGVTGALWAWSGSYQNNDSTVKVREPLRYTLEFQDNGDVNILADCNLAKGSYTLQADGKISIDVGVMTKIACPPDSQSVEFLKELAEVDASLQQDGALILNFKADTGGMKFAPYIPLDLPEPPDGAASASTRANIPVRLGPDGGYPPYGILRAGAHAEIIGKYTPWWAVRLPGHPDEIGWISQQQVQTSGAENAPSLPPPAIDFGRSFPLPGFEEPQVLVTDPTLILAGPSEKYPAVLAGLSAANLYVLGKSQDELYWLVYLPPEMVSAGMGWISAGSVLALNTDNVPVVKAPLVPAAGMYPAPGAPLAAALTSINFRSGPDLSYDVLDFALKGQIVPVLGRTQDGSWLQVQVPASVSASLKAWLAAPNVYVFNPEKVLIVPTPLPAWVPTSVTNATCSVVSQTPVDGTSFHSNKDFSLVIELANNTGKTWSRGNVDIAFVAPLGGDALHTGPDAYDFDYSVLPGQTYRQTIPATSTFGSGDLGEIWAVMEAGEPICSFTYRISVIAPTPTATYTFWPTQTGTIEPTPPPDVPPTATVGTKEPTPPPEVTPTPRY